MRLASTESHGRPDIFGVSQRLGNRTSKAPMFTDVESAAPMSGRRKLAYDGFIFAVDGSGSMGPCWSSVQSFLGVVRYVAAKYKIPVFAVHNNDADTGLLCNGGTNPIDTTKDIGRILASSANGNTDFAAASITRIVSLCGSRFQIPQRARLIFVSDCSCTAADVEITEKYRSNLGMPSSLLAFSNSHSNVDVAHQVLSRSAARMGTSHGTIHAPSSIREEGGLSDVFSLFCNWAREPDQFAHANRKPAQARAKSAALSAASMEMSQNPAAGSVTIDSERQK